MPRKKEPSFELKKLIWEKAATIGKMPEVILRVLDHELQRLREKDMLYEDTPDVRTIKRIIEKDLDRLDPEVVIAKLPPHIWHLRKDHENIKSLADENIKSLADKTTQESPESKELQTTALIIASNLEKIRSAPPQSLGDPFGNTVYRVEERVLGGSWEYEDRARLGDVDRAVSAKLLKRLQDEGGFPELADIDDWRELKEDSVTEDFIQRLNSRAHRGNF